MMLFFTVCLGVMVHVFATGCLAVLADARLRARSELYAAVALTTLAVLGTIGFWVTR